MRREHSDQEKCGAETAEWTELVQGDDDRRRRASTRDDDARRQDNRRRGRTRDRERTTACPRGDSVNRHGALDQSHMVGSSCLAVKGHVRAKYNMAPCR